MSRFLIALVSAALLMSFATGDSGYEKKIKQHREEVDKEFADPEKSPLKEKATDFESLEYFPIDKKYRVKAKVTLTEDADPFEMPTSDPNRNKQYVKYAVLSFELDGQLLELSVYRSLRLAQMEEYKDHLFLPFKDMTNGAGTYGGGRYLDLTVPKGKKMVIDFNLCYNPYCAYSDGWSCPVPPEENVLMVPVPAGVKDYGKH